MMTTPRPDAVRRSRQPHRAMLAHRLRLLALVAFCNDAAAIDADWRHFAAGAVSASLSHGYTTPIDVIKTRMQTNPELYGGSVSTAAKRIVKEEGVGFLAQGLAPTCAGYGVEGALKFGCYELLKPIFAEITPYKVFNYLCASVVAGAVASVVLCPAEEVPPPPPLEPPRDCGWSSVGALPCHRVSRPA